MMDPFMNKQFLASIETLLVSPDFISDPYPVLAELRAEAPVYWSDAIGGWILTRYDDIIASFKDTEHFSNENRLGRAIDYLPPDRRAHYKAFESHYATKGLLHSDPPDHTRMRSLMNREFNPAVVQEMRPRIQALVNELLDSVGNRGQMDLIPDLAEALPVGVIASILGIPPSDRHLFKKWTDSILGFQGVNKPSEAELARAQDALVDIRRYLVNIIAERRRNPTNDLLGKLVVALGNPDSITESELINTCVTLFTAGHETTLSLIANTIYTLLANPGELETLRQDPALLPKAIEESLRYESPVARQTRLIKSPVDFGGKRLEQGQIVFQMLNAANRDPAYFEQPDAFNIRREKNKHIAFGYGTHFCLGAVLARAEATIAIGSVLQRFPNLELIDATPDWDLTKRNSRVLNSLRVSF
jgi:cytochrome P450